MLDSFGYSAKMLNTDNISLFTESCKSDGGSKNGFRRIICRYGRGCTHIQDPTHRERFWHPESPVLSDNIVSSHHMCNECGMAFLNLAQLQLHLKRKTAWSNTSLIGCRISCLVDYKEWHEGVVTQYHKSGKHFVEFRLVNERRWLNMKKVAFYIVERPHHGNMSEYKSSEDDISETVNDSQGLAPVDDWVYVEDISLEYTLSQSLLLKIYGGNVQETGHKTKGHTVLTDADKERAKNGHGSLLYGELLPRGANKAFSGARLSVAEATCLFDLGMGTGKIVVQAFLQYRNLRYVYGVELSLGRYSIAEEAILRLVRLIGEDRFKVVNVPGKRLVVEELEDNIASTPPTFKVHSLNSGFNDSNDYFEILKSVPINGNAFQSGPRVLCIECGDMFHVSNIDIADIVMLETDIPSEMHPQLCRLLSRMKEGSRTLTYLDLKKIWSSYIGILPFRQLECNKYLSDRYPTSWSVQRGHHFFLWVRVADSMSSYSSDSIKPTQKTQNNTTTISSSPLSAQSASGIAESNPDRKRATNISTASKSGNCLPFNFEFMTFGFLSRLHRRRESRDSQVERVNVIVPVNSDGSRVTLMESSAQSKAFQSEQARLSPSKPSQDQPHLNHTNGQTSINGSGERTNSFGVSFSSFSKSDESLNESKRSSESRLKVSEIISTLLDDASRELSLNQKDSQVRCHDLDRMDGSGNYDRVMEIPNLIADRSHELSVIHAVGSGLGEFAESYLTLSREFRVDETLDVEPDTNSNVMNDDRSVNESQLVVSNCSSPSFASSRNSFVNSASNENGTNEQVFKDLPPEKGNCLLS